MPNTYHRLKEEGKLPEIIALSLSMSFSVFLELIRIKFSGSLSYVFLIWNLFLAFIPYTVSLALYLKSRDTKNFTLGMLIMLGIWLLFFPNTFYIITDLFHLKQRQHIPLWFDTLLIVSFAWNGILLGYLSLYRVQLVIARFTRKWFAWVCSLIFLMMAAFGIYLGRFLRWNSWNVLTEPKRLAIDILLPFLHPFHHIPVFTVTLLMGTFLCLGYGTFYTIGMTQRRHQ